jgi:hypothetical protein
MMNNKPDVASEEMERQVRREIAKQEANRSAVTDWMALDADGSTLVTRYFDDLPLLKRLEAIAQSVAKGREQPCKVVAGHDGVEVLRTTRTGTRLAELCNRFGPDLLVRHRHHDFNPWIKMMVVALSHWHPGHRFDVTASGIRISAEDGVSLGRMVRFVRRVSQSSAFKRRLQEERRLALQNDRSACAYLISLFARHSRLLILRVDLYYTGAGREEAQTEEARASFERFVRMLRTGRIVPEVLGYLFSREVGAERGVHFHLMVVMDGHKYLDADGYTRRTGERWVKDYTGRGRGTFFNCYARRHEYEYNGLGLVHLSDWPKLIGLRLAIQYMTKGNYLIKPKGRGEKNFRRGLVKQVSVKLGAPRQSDHEMSTVCRILGEQVPRHHSK